MGEQFEPDPAVDDALDAPGVPSDTVPLRSSRPENGAGAIAMAAMLGLANALDMAPPNTDEIVTVADADGGEPGLDLDFGHLDPLE